MEQILGSRPHQKSPRPAYHAGGGFENEKKSGDTYFRTCGTIIGSESLTAVFEKGTGGSFRICSPENGPAGIFHPAEPVLVDFFIQHSWVYSKAVTLPLLPK